MLEIHSIQRRFLVILGSQTGSHNTPQAKVHNMTKKRPLTHTRLSTGDQSIESLAHLNDWDASNPYQTEMTIYVFHKFMNSLQVLIGSIINFQSFFFVVSREKDAFTSQHPRRNLNITNHSEGQFQ